MHLLNPQPWMLDGSCATHPEPDIWFPAEDRNFARNDQNRREAIRICNACPVQAECAEFGKKQRHGIWGGLEKTRKRYDLAETA